MKVPKAELHVANKMKLNPEVYLRRCSSNYLLRVFGNHRDNSALRKSASENSVTKNHALSLTNADKLVSGDLVHLEFVKLGYFAVRRAS